MDFTFSLKMIDNQIKCWYYDSASLNQFAANILNNSRGLWFFHLNARSLRNEQDELEIYLHDLHIQFDILAFTETWITDKDDAVTLGGYTAESVYRKDRRGGGVSLYIRHNLCYSVLRTSD